MISIESPHKRDFYKYTQYTIFNIRRKIDLNYLKSAVMGFFPRDSSMSSKQPCKRAISVRAIDTVNVRIPKFSALCAHF